MKLSTADIQLIRSYFAEQPVLRAYLFGSYARYTAVKTSDIDILVELDYSKRIGLGFVKMKLELEDKLKRSVDLVSDKAVSSHIKPFINSDKQLIYEK